MLLIALPLAPRAASALRAGGFTLDSLESARARALLERELGLPPSALVIVYSSATERAGSAGFEAAAAAAAGAIADAPHVTRIASHVLAPDQVSADGTTAYDVILLDLPPDESPDALPGVRDRLAALPPGPVDVALAGGPAFYGDIQAVSEADLRRSEIVSLPLAALALLVVFGAVVAAGLPLAVGGGAVVVALALIWVVAGLTQMSIFVLNLATLLGLGLGVDYSLLMTSRFREELGRRRTADRGGADAVAEAVAVDGHDRRPGGLLLGPHRPARADRADPVRVPDPALGGDRRRHRGRPGGDRGADPPAGDPERPRRSDRRRADPPGQRVRGRRTGHGPGSPGG